MEVRLWKLALFLAAVGGAAVAVHPTPLQIATWHERALDYDRALEGYRRAALDRARDPRTALRYAELLVRQGRLDEARGQILEQVLASPEPLPPARLLAKLHEDLLEPEESLDMGEHAWRYRPRELEWLRPVVEGRWWRKDWGRVRVLLEDALREGAALDRRLWELLALSMERLGDLEAAIQVRSEHLAVEVEDLRTLADLYQRTARPEEELGLRREVARLVPGTWMALELAVRLEALGRYPEAIRAYEAETPLRPADRGLSRHLAELALVHAPEEGPSLAGDHLRRWPDEVALHVQLAAHRAALGEAAAARGHHEAVVGLLPGRPASLVEMRWRVVSLAALGRRDEAAALWEAILEARPREPEVLAEVVAYDLDAGRLERAAERLDRLRTLEPASRVARVLAARLFLARDEHGRAADELDGLLDEEGATSEARAAVEDLEPAATLGAGRWQRGHELARRAALRDPRPAVLWNEHVLSHRYRPQGEAESTGTSGPGSEGGLRFETWARGWLTERVRLEAGARLVEVRQGPTPPFPAVDERLVAEGLRLDARLAERWSGWLATGASTLGDRTHPQAALGARWERRGLSAQAEAAAGEAAEEPIELVAEQGAEGRLEGEVRWRPAPRLAARGGYRGRAIRLHGRPSVPGLAQDLGREDRLWAGVESPLVDAERAYLGASYQFTWAELDETSAAVFQLAPLLDAQRLHSLGLYGYGRWGRYWEAEAALGYGLDTTREVGYASASAHLTRHLADRLRLAAGYEVAGEAEAAGGGAVRRWTGGLTWLF
ncbi:MAG: hypothetical protein HY722_04685 [Planctomycetes bacterium]|nr:hypothetical protein [Planctomycetota bacterium]